MYINNFYVYIYIYIMSNVVSLSKKSKSLCFTSKKSFWRVMMKTWWKAMTEWWKNEGTCYLGNSLNKNIPSKKNLGLL